MGDEIARVLADVGHPSVISHSAGIAGTARAGIGGTAVASNGTIMIQDETSSWITGIVGETGIRPHVPYRGGNGQLVVV